MAKQPSPKKRLMYRGAFYDAVELSGTIMYKGGFYDAVQAPRTVLADVDTKGLRDALNAMKEYSAEQNLTEEEKAERQRTKERFTPALDPSVVDLEEEPEPEEGEEKVEKKKAPEKKDKLPWEEEGYRDKQTLRDALMPFVAQLVDEAADTLNRNSIATSGPVQFDADEADGVDVSAAVATGGFAAIKDAKVIFDYNVNLPADYLELLKERLQDKGLADVEKDGFVAKLFAALPGLKNIHLTPKLQEVVFRFCKHGFAGSGGTTDELLKTVGYLQSVKDVRPGTLMQVPTEEATEDQIKEWASEIFKQIIENEMHHHAGVDIWRKSEWGKKVKMQEVIKGLGVKKILGGDQVSKLEAVLNPMKSTEYAELIRDILTPSQEGTRFSLKQKVDELIKELTKHEKYTGDVKYGIAEDGNIVASIDAPYPFVYILTQPAGGHVKLKEAGTEICDFAFTVNTPDSAKHLLTASLNLADAYKRAVNPSVSQNRKERDAEDLFLKIHDLSKQLKEEDALQEKPPTGEEALDQPA